MKENYNLTTKDLDEIEITIVNWLAEQRDIIKSGNVKRQKIGTRLGIFFLGNGSGVVGIQVIKGSAPTCYQAFFENNWNYVEDENE